MKIFVSMPMKGKTYDEILGVQETWFHDYLEWHEEIKSAELMHTISPDHESKGALWCLGWSLEQMDAADIVLFAPGWENARGCRIEHEAAKKYGKKIYAYEFIPSNRIMGDGYIIGHEE